MASATTTRFTVKLTPLQAIRALFGWRIPLRLTYYATDNVEACISSTVVHVENG